MTAQSQPKMRQPMGMRSVVRMTIATAVTNEMMSATRKRETILGTSCQKLERSTSFFVAPHVMLYENRCARRACERWMLRPPKKKKLRGRVTVNHTSGRDEKAQ